MTNLPQNAIIYLLNVLLKKEGCGIKKCSKIIVLVLSAILVVSLFSGCGRIKSAIQGFSNIITNSKNENSNEPYIGENGNWWIYGIDTGISADGQVDVNSGQIAETESGKTDVLDKYKDFLPYIGPNGNWWIKGKDSGIPVETEIPSSKYNSTSSDNVTSNKDETVSDNTTTSNTPVVSYDSPSRWIPSYNSPKPSSDDPIRFIEPPKPDVDLVREFEIMGIASNAAVDYDQMSFFSYMEKQTGIKINFIGVAENAIEARKTLAIQSGDMPDMFAFKHDTFSDYELYKYGKEGVIVDLMRNGYLKTYAPNTYKELENNPTAMALNMDPDGHLYTLPGPMPKTENYGNWLNINKTWLKNLGLKTPTTTSEFLNVMRAFRDRDPNGNGQKDEVPFAIYDWDANFITSFWGVSINAGNCGIDNNGKVYYMPTTPNARQACIWWNEFKSESGLVDSSVVGSSDSYWQKFRNHIQSGKIGCFVWSQLQADSFDPALLKNYEAIAFPSAYFINSKLRLSDVCNPYSMTATRGNRIITKSCKNAPALLRYFDLFFKDEYIMAANYGDPALGLYKKTSDGSYELTKKVAQLKTNEGPGWLMGLPRVNALSKPLVEDADTKNKVYREYLEAANTTYREAHKKNPIKVFPNIMKTADEITNLKKYAHFDSDSNSKILASYVTGWKDVNNWTTWANTLDSKGLSNYVKIWQAIVDRNRPYLVSTGK